MVTLIQLLLFSALVIESSIAEQAMLPPRYPPWPKWLEGLMNKHLTLLSLELYRDTFQKMKNIMKSATDYQSKPSYTIGIIASSIYGQFNRMLIIYKDIVELRKYKHKDLTVRTSLKDALMAFGQCQSIYHQIRLEKKLFEEVLLRYANEEKARRDRTTTKRPKKKLPFVKKMSTPKDDYKFKGGMYVQRRRDADDDGPFNEADFDSNFQLPLLANQKKNENPPKLLKKLPVHSNPTIATPLPVNLYAPPPEKELVTPINPLVYLTKPKLLVPNPILESYLPKDLLIPIEFPKPKASNPSVLKLMSQLNIDNPELNPDLDKFMRERYKNRRQFTEEFDPRRSERNGRRSGNIMQKLKSNVENNVAPLQKENRNEDIDVGRFQRTQRLESDSNDQASKLIPDSDRPESQGTNTDEDLKVLKFESNKSRRKKSENPEVRQQNNPSHRSRRFHGSRRRQQRKRSNTRNNSPQYDPYGVINKALGSHLDDASFFMEHRLPINYQQRTKKKNVSPRWKPKIL